MPAIVDHGIPVVTSRQWTTALTPDAGGTGWNFIAASWTGGPGIPVEWVVVKDLTGTPSQVIFQTTTHHYPNSNIRYLNATINQIRAANGRIFFPLFGGNTAYYDPTTEAITELPTVPEVPPVNPNSSTTFYSASFDVGGLLYFGTQESQQRSPGILVTDTNTLAQSFLGYVGSALNAYTTYAYRLAPDTGTAVQYIYVAVGEDPWQLWALNITPGPNFGVATKLYEVTSTGNISFVNEVGQGWVAQIDTDLGKPDNVRTFLWCLDGATYPYTTGQPPPSGAPAARNVTPAHNYVVTPPDIDSTGGIGVVGWRPYGSPSSTPYNIVNYSVTYSSPSVIENLVASNNGIVGQAADYNGVFRCDGGLITWYGPWVGGLSRGPFMNVDGIDYFAGYPNGVLFGFDPTQPWNPNAVTNPNPKNLGNYGLNGTQFAGIKYGSWLAWGELAGANGELFCSGTRERNGVGSGIGSWDRSSKAFAGIYSATGMDTVLPSGTCVLGGISRVVMSTKLITPPGTADLFVFDYNMNFIAALPVINNLSNLGPIFETTTPNVITGIVQGSGNSLGLWQYNVQTQTFIQYVELPIIGDLNLENGQVAQRVGGSVWLMSGNNLVTVDISNLTAVVKMDLTSIAPISRLAFSSDPSTLFLAGGINSGVSGAQLFSINFGNVLGADTGTGVGIGFDAQLKANGGSRMSAGIGVGVGVGYPAILVHPTDTGARTGDNVVPLLNDESTDIRRGQPVFSNAEASVRLACGDDSGESHVVGLVADALIPADDFGGIGLSGTVNATAADWDFVCGTQGGLAAGTTYYLHPSIPGRLTATPTSTPGTELVPVIQAVSPTLALIVIQPAVLL